MIGNDIDRAENSDETDGAGCERYGSASKVRRYWSTTSVLEMATAYNRNCRPALWGHAVSDWENDSSFSESASDDERSSSCSDSTPSDDDFSSLAASALPIKPALSLPDLVVAGTRHATISSTDFRSFQRQISSRAVAGNVSANDGRIRRSASVDSLTEPIATNASLRKRSLVDADVPPLRMIGYQLPTWSSGLSHSEVTSHRKGDQQNTLAKYRPSLASQPSTALAAGARGTKCPPPACRRPSYAGAVDRELQSYAEEQARRTFPSLRRKKPRADSERTQASWPVTDENRHLEIPESGLTETGVRSGPSTPTGSRRGSLNSPLLRRLMSPFNKRRTSLPTADKTDEERSPSRTRKNAVGRNRLISSDMVLSASPGVLNRLGLSPMMTRRIRIVSLAEGEENGSMSSFLSTPPIRPFYQSIMEVDVRHLGEELTLIDAELEKGIEARELINCAWMSNARNTVAPNVMKMVDHFNHLALKTTSEVLRPMEPENRAKVIGFWIKVAEECLKLQNFNSLKAILAGLQCTPMFRLKKTWKEVSANKKKRFDDLSELMAEDRNYAQYRKRMELALKEPPCLPFLGVFLTQITQMDAFNKLHKSHGSRRNSSRLSRRLSRRGSTQLDSGARKKSVRRVSSNSKTTSDGSDLVKEKPSLHELIPENPVLEDRASEPDTSTRNDTQSDAKCDSNGIERKDPDSPTSVFVDVESPSADINGKLGQAAKGKRTSIGDDSAYGSDSSGSRGGCQAVGVTKRSSPGKREKVVKVDRKSSPRSSPLVQRGVSVDSGAPLPAHPVVSRVNTSPSIVRSQQEAKTNQSPQPAKKTRRSGKDGLEKKVPQHYRNSISQQGSNSLSRREGGLAAQHVSVGMSLEDQLEVYRTAASAYRHSSRPWVRYMLDHMSYNTEEENYKLSLEREPRQSPKSSSWLDRFKAL